MYLGRWLTRVAPPRGSGEQGTSCMTNAVLAKLRAFVTGTAIEECELCAETISVEHEHLLEPDARRVFCACTSCAALFSEEQQRQGARYLRLQRRAARLVGDRKSVV